MGEETRATRDVNSAGRVEGGQTFFRSEVKFSSSCGCALKTNEVNYKIILVAQSTVSLFACYL